VEKRESSERDTSKRKKKKEVITIIKKRTRITEGRRRVGEKVRTSQDESEPS